VIMLSKPITKGGPDPLDSPSVIFLGINAAAARNALTSPALQTTSESKTKQDMPLNLVIGQDLIKSALILLAVAPRIGGVVLSGGRGTGKSVMARALHRLMPPIEVIAGSDYNIDPSATSDLDIDDFLRVKLTQEKKDLKDLPAAIIPCPFVQIPVNVMEDRLFGSVDVRKTLETGDTMFTPGLLAAAHRGVLYVDDIHLLDTDLAAMLLQSVADGFVLVEREGISIRYPCRPILIATSSTTGSGESGDGLKDAFLDRIGIALSSEASNLSIEDRVEAVNTVITFNPEDSHHTANAAAKLRYEQALENEEQLKSSIIFAREYLKDIQLSSNQIHYLCEEAIRGGLQGHRGEIAAARVAMAAAALEDAGKVRADDLRLAVKLAIIPRSIYREQMEQMDMDNMPPPPPAPPQQAPKPKNTQEPEKDAKDQDQDDQDQDDEQEEQEQEEEEEEEEEQPEGEPSIPEEFMFDAVNVNLEDDLMKFNGRQKAGKGGKSGILFSRDRGRYVRPVIPKEGQPLRVAIDATLREAAKNQIYRRTQAMKEGKEDGNKIYVETSDVRGKLMARKAGSLLIFAVDASGSMALNRMNAAKGAACALLQEAYQSRDKIALIPFQGARAEVLLPPTRSISLAKNRLDMMPCGGGSPLAHALTQCVKTGLNAMASGDTGRCVVVLISDGRANIPLSVSLDEEQPAVPTNPDGTERKLTDAEKKEQRQQLKDEVLACARQMAELPNFKLLVIDTENKFVSTGMAKEIAQAANGRYHFIPKASAQAMKQVTVEAVASLKRSNK
jgi:magnesium chelatase subunit D